MNGFRTGGALGRVVRSGVGRRRVQTVVIAVATMMAVASAVVAGSLIVASNAPFDHAFAQQRGAHLTVQFDPGRVSTARLEATGEQQGVTASAGPFPTTTIKPVDSVGGHLPTLTLVGRPAPQADVDDLDLKSGRWAANSGEVVLDASFSGPALELGSTLKASDDVDSPALTIVGFALSVSRTADAWATPAQTRALASARTPLTSQMLYRFDSAGTEKQLTADRKRLVATLPSGALLGSQSYLQTKRDADEGAAPTIPFLIAFGVLGIVMSVIIVGSVTSGAVGSSLRRIGTEVLIGPLAAATSRIRVGSGGIMLPHYSPFKVAETFSVLSGLYPERIDLGLGRAPGTDGLTMFALQRDRREASPDDFPQQLSELLGYLNRSLPADHPFARLAATLPGSPSRPEPWLLGSSPQSAIWAGQLGLRYSFADFINPAGAEIAALYRQQFADSEEMPTPVLSVAVWAICAETTEEAQRLAASARMSFRLLRQGRLIPVPPVEKALRYLEQEGASSPEPGRDRRGIIGDPEKVRAGIEEVAKAYGAEEVMVVTITHDHGARRRSYELIAEAFGLASVTESAASATAS